MAKRRISATNRKRTAKAITTASPAESYTHPTAEALLRPDVGTQAQFRKKKPPKTYRYDSSLSPELNWDGHPARELGEWLLAMIEEAAQLDPPHRFPTPRELKGNDGKTLATVAGLSDAVDQLKRLAKPFLNWAGKAERLSFDVPTLPLFIHERLSTAAILETLKGHKRDKQLSLFDLFGDREHPIHDQVLRAYEHKNGWVNRMILGDSLVVMNSLLNYEGLGGQVQCIYMDPPYGVKFGSNFQPFVRKRVVEHNDDDDMTREPEMVKAYRDTWELGPHSYLTYIRDRLLLARELLTPTGSIFVQISDENLHHVRELLDEVFGVENLVSVIPFRKKTMPLGTVFLEQMSDFLLWYAKTAYDQSGKRNALYNRLYLERTVEGEFHHCWYELPDGTRHRMSRHQLYDHALLPPGARVYRLKSLEPSGPMASGMYDREFEGVLYKHPKNGWGTPPAGMDRLVEARRIQPEGTRLTFIMYADEGTATQLTAPWTDTIGADDKSYAVQTNQEVIRRCIMMCTNPGDLVLDPTCGSGTTAYVAEKWGRRWITIDTSRVPLALARQRLLTATFDYYELQDEPRGPAGGFIYKRKQNKKGEEVGGIVPHVTLESIANNEPPKEEVLVDRPEKDPKITRVTGPFCVEATIPTPVDWDDDPSRDREGADSPSPQRSPEGDGRYVDRMLEVLRRSPVLQLGGGKTVTLKNVRPPAKTLSLSAEAMVEGGIPGKSIALDEAVQQSLERDGHALPLSGKPIAIVFGPENGAVSERLVFESAREAHAKQYAHLFVIGFGIQANALKLVNDCERAVGIAASYSNASMDLTMGDLLKNMRSSQIFSVCGLPDIELRRAEEKDVQALGGDAKIVRWYQVELKGLDVCDPVTMQTDHRTGNDVPAWFLDTDYNGLCFHVCQAFFPRTAAWDDLKRSLKAEFDPSVWEHLAGTICAPFEAGKHGEIAVKVIDDRGNELLVVKSLRKG